MKKVNFNALKNFEVPESWIENAINAKPKKKPFYLNPRYYGTAAAMVIAAGIAVFSLLYLNRDFTPPTVQNVEATSASSTLSGQMLTEILSGGEIKTTELQNGTKPTEKPKATGASEPTEGNEESNEQNIDSENQESGNTNLEDRTPAQAEQTEPKENSVRSEHSEQNEQPGRNEQKNNTKKPESNIQPQKPTAPINQQQNKEQKQESGKTEELEPKKPTTPIEQQQTTEKEQESSKPESGKIEDPEPTAPGESYTITTSWVRSSCYPPRSDSPIDDYYGDGTTTRVCYNGLFEKRIIISIPENIWNQGDDIVFSCTITGVDENTSGICGTLIFEYDNLQPEKLIIDLSYYSVNIPCGDYDIDFNCRIYGSEQPFCSQTFSKQLLDNDEDITLELVYNN